MNGFEPDHPGAAVRPSPNFGPRRDGARPELLILHYTGMASGRAAEDWLCNPVSEVSCHYIVHEDGRIVQMIREADRAWHAGAGSWKGKGDVNSRSVGIEIVNGGHAFGLPDFPMGQIEAVIALARGICARNGIGPASVLAHSDIAPGRKSDPGEKFPWEMLSAAGVGITVETVPARDIAELGPGEEGEEVARFQKKLAAYGYGIDSTGIFDPETERVTRAFQLHFRRAKVDGVADAATRDILSRLVERAGAAVG